MTEQELREKIVEVIRKRLTELVGSCRTDKIPLDSKSAEIVMEFANELADALIAAGIGDVKKAELERKAYEVASNQYRIWFEEQKDRAEVWKQATKDMIDTDICFGCRARATGICFKQNPNPETDECMNAIYKQAEKELQEEKNDDRFCL